MSDTQMPIGDLVFAIYVMCGSNDSAVHIAARLVNDDLIACANVMGGTKSFYKWDNALQMDDEVTLFMKTSGAKLEAAIEKIKELHTYEVPCITAWPIDRGNADYLKWVTQATC